MKLKVVIYEESKHPYYEMKRRVLDLEKPEDYHDFVGKVQCAEVNFVVTGINGITMGKDRRIKIDEIVLQENL